MIAITYAGYVDCDQCGFPFFQASPKISTCPLCDTNMGRIKNKLKAEVTPLVEPPVVEPPVVKPEKKMYHRKCEYCGKPFNTTRSLKRYCADDCRAKTWRESKRPPQESIRCAICGSVFESARRRVVCGPKCRKIYKRNITIEWHRVNRAPAKRPSIVAEEV